MQHSEFLSLIEQRLAALEASVEALADRRLTEEVKRAIDIARVDLPFALAKARYVLEMIVHDIYHRERPQAKPKPLFSMIEELCAQEGLFSRKIATDINYIRINGNLIVHAQDEPVEITDRQVEVIVLVTINLVEWYLTSYLPGRIEARGEVAPRLPPPPNPYRGLLAFREEDAPNYFGREPDVADVLAAVEHQPLVAVVGASGSGKSSLVFAGVVAKLRAADDWTIAAFRPRRRPYNELAQALVALWQSDPVERLSQAASLAKHWAAAEIALTDTVQETLRQTGSQRLLLIADQFEELYTLGQEPAVTAGFIDLLVQAIEDAAPPPDGGQRPNLCVLATLRADFLGHALIHRGLAAVMDRYPKKLLGPVEDNARLRSIIEQPAKRAGVELEDLLVERILRDLAQLPGTDHEARGTSLPLLEFTLAQLWDQQHERRLTHLGYEGLGGIQQALSRHADSVYAGFDTPERTRVRHVLVQMVRPGEGTGDTRQVATREQVRPENWPLVTRLADQRLVVTGHDEASGQDTAEIIHEALIRHWQPLREWLREDRSFRLWQNGLRQALAEWERTGRDPGALLAGARLAEAEERLAAHADHLSQGEVDYIRASIARREEESAEHERQRRERERLQRRISFGLAGFLAVALALAGLAGWQWQVAENHLTEANHNFGLMFSEKAEIALREKDFNAARLYSLYGLARMKPEAVEERAAALGRILGSPLYRVVFSTPHARNREPTTRASVAFSPDGRLLALVGSADHTVRVWEMASGQSVATLTTGIAGFVSVAFSPDGRLVASGSMDNTVHLWEVASGQPVAILRGHTQPVLSVAFSPDGRLLASASDDSTVRLWEVASGQRVATLSNGGFGVAFSPDGRLLASGSDVVDQPLRLWKVANGQPVAMLGVLGGHTQPVSSVAFSPDGRLLASGSWDNTVRLWEVASGQPVAILRGHTQPVSSMAFSPDGRLLASGSDDATVRLWEVASGQSVATLSGHTQAGSRVAFSPDGQLLASGPLDSGPLDNTVRLWEVASGQPMATLRGHTQPVSSVAFSPDGRLLASGSLNDTVRLWEVAALQDLLVVSENVIEHAEREFQLQLQGDLRLGPLYSEPNLHGPMVQEPLWPATHPFHWLPAAERGDVDAMVQLGLIYARSDDIEQARVWYRKAAEAGNAEGKDRLALLDRHLTWQRVEALWQQIQQRTEAGEHAQAIEVLGDLLTLDPENANAYLTRALLYGGQKQYDHAITDLQQAIQLDPDFADAYGFLGLTRILQGRFADALEPARKAHELSRQNLAWTMKLGHVHLLQGDAATARQYYERALPLIPNEAAFQAGPVADFKLFIERGWQVEASRAALAWMRESFAERAEGKLPEMDPPR